MLPPLPASMTAKLGRRALSPGPTVGMTGDALYWVEGEPASLLKVSTRWQAELEYQAQALRWLEGRLPVARVLAFEKGEGLAALWMTRLKGADGVDLCRQAAPEEVATSFALALRQVHSLPIDNCPLDQRLDRKVALAEARARNGEVDEDDLDECRRGLPVEELLGQLHERRPKDEDLVFTHGDYCVPNVMFEQGQLSGFVDLGRCGVADRYQDLALLVRSLALKVNAGQDLSGVVAKVYAIDKWDQAKVEYYQLLDEFF